MFELPDKRAVLIFAFLLPVALLYFVVPSTSTFALTAEVLLYVTCVGAGLAFTVLDVREGYCMNRPSVTRAETPLLFWSEVLASCFLMSVGFYKLWQLL
jgi:hypothetical protein